MPYANNKGASSQSDQRHCCWLSGSYHASTCYSRNFKTLASLNSWADRFESCLVANPEDSFLMTWLICLFVLWCPCAHYGFYSVLLTDLGGVSAAFMWLLLMNRLNESGIFKSYVISLPPKDLLFKNYLLISLKKKSLHPRSPARAFAVRTQDVWT